jgi:hypothetical protein
VEQMEFVSSQPQLPLELLLDQEHAKR